MRYEKPTMYVISQEEVEQSIFAGACSTWNCNYLGWYCNVNYYNNNCYLYNPSKCDPNNPANMGHGNYPSAINN